MQAMVAELYLVLSSLKADRVLIEPTLSCTEVNISLGYYLPCTLQNRHVLSV